MHLTIGKGDKELVELLIKRGAYIGKKMLNAITRGKWISAEEYARLLGAEEIERLLRTTPHS